MPPVTRSDTIAGIAAVIALVAAIFTGLQWNEARETRMQGQFRSAAAFDSPYGPVECAPVSREVNDVGGRAKKAEGEDLWLLLYSKKANVYYLPMGDEVQPGADGIWRAGKIIVGNSQSSGSEYTLIVIAGTSSASVKIRDAIAHPKGEDPYLAEIPSASKELASVCVRRR